MAVASSATLGFGLFVCLFVGPDDVLCVRCVIKLFSGEQDDGQWPRDGAEMEPLRTGNGGLAGWQSMRAIEAPIATKLS